MLGLSNAYLDPKSPPTIFELSLSQTLSSSLQPAFDFTLNILSEQSGLARRAVAFKDECFLALMLLVERSYLAASDGAFEENFYGLRRAANLQGALLSPSQKLSSLFELVLLPYLLKKLAALPARLDPLSSRAATARLALALYEVVVLVFQASYVSGRVNFFSPLHFFQDVYLVRLNGDDIRRQQAAAAAALGVGWSGGLLDKARFLFTRALGALQSSLVLAAVVFKLAQLYQSPDNRTRREAMQRGSAASLLPPPPLVLPPTPQGALLLRDPNLCPLCGEPRTNPAMSSSGYCFCFVCISNYVKEHGTCPVAGTRCSQGEIRRLFFTG